MNRLDVLSNKYNDDRQGLASRGSSNKTTASSSTSSSAPTAGVSNNTTSSTSKSTGIAPSITSAITITTTPSTTNATSSSTAFSSNTAAARSSSRPTSSSLKPPTFPSPFSAQRAAPPITASSSSTPQAEARARQKVVLQPGHSPLDWANLNRNAPKHKLRGVPPNFPPPQVVRIDKTELKKHKTRDDCWTCINGKVFNITPYVNFHPGGVEEIMKCAGRDGTVLFNKYHSWVNADRMLENCIVGIMVK
ncbi:hypothetical protein PVL30_001628 [Lodderomyces elongisporus]|uniref:uncharacterized protein n=1 Tax=Lodderomyces elongisporus TaxID=36914 RepID=UPI00292591E9|nr:uncharacterized protein PVL30_001628 [Lodderomyces elongisporus]WLF77905.1 hypothetical protein PVL30_001628 [Lodderomyces elongisporus]